MKTAKVSRSLVNGFGYENHRRDCFEEYREQKKENRRAIRFKMSSRDQRKREQKLFG